MRFINKATMESEFRLRHGVVVIGKPTGIAGVVRQRFYDILGRCMKENTQEGDIGDVSRMTHYAALEINPDPVQITYRPDGTIADVVTSTYTTIHFDNGWLVDDKYNGLGWMREAWHRYIRRPDQRPMNQGAESERDRRRVALLEQVMGGGKPTPGTLRRKGRK